MPRPLGRSPRLEQRLLLARLERAGHGERIDQMLDRRACSIASEFGGDAVALEERLERGDQPVAVDSAHRRPRDRRAQRCQSGTTRRNELRRAAARRAMSKRATPSSVMRSGRPRSRRIDDAAGAAGAIDRRLAGIARAFLRLDHADQAVARQRVVGHGEIARLEDVERQPAARQQQHAGQRKDRQASPAARRSCGSPASLMRTGSRTGACAPARSADRRADRLEEFDQLLARRLLVPFAVARARARAAGRSPASRSPAAKSAEARSSRA